MCPFAADSLWLLYDVIQLKLAGYRMIVVVHQRDSTCSLYCRRLGYTWVSPASPWRVYKSAAQAVWIQSFVESL